MSADSHLWAIAYDDVTQADKVREQISNLAWGSGHAGKYLILLDIVVVVRNPDGSFTIDRQPFPSVANVLGCTVAGFLAGLALATPLTGAAIGAVVGGVGSAAWAAQAGISPDFVKEVEALMKPGTSALFVLDDQGDLEMILQTIKGLGGKVVKTNVDVERAKLIQSTLAAESPE